MKEKTLSAVFLLCLCGSVVCALMAGHPYSAHRDFDILPALVQDLGEIRQGTSTKLQFELRNRTSESIRIVDIGTSCRCTTSEVSKSAIGLADSSLITLTYKSGQARGPIRIHATVVYQRGDDEQIRSITLQAHGTIDPDYNAKPERLRFEESRAGVCQVELSPRHCSGLKIDKVVCDMRFFTARVVETNDPARTKVEVAFDPTEFYADAGPAHLAVFTDNKVQPMLLIPLEVELRNETPAKRRT